MTVATETLTRLSFSQMRQYTACPAKWWFSRHLPPEHTPSPLKFGRAIHKAVAAFYEGQLAGGRLEPDQLVAVYDEAWAEPEDVEIRFGKGEDTEGLRSMAARMLRAFVETVEPGEIIAVEQPFAVEIGEGVLVSGVVDLVEIKDGRFWVVDNKTSKNAPSSAFDIEQVALYRLGLVELGLIPEDANVGLRYDVLRKLKTKGEFVSIEVETTGKDLDDLRQKLGQVARAIQEGIVYRTRGWQCSGCPWSRACAETDLAGA